MTVKSIEEQIAELKKQLSETSGPGSVAKKKGLQEQIVELEEAISDTSGEKADKEIRDKELPPENKKAPEEKDEDKESKEKTADDDIEVFNPRPMPTKWVEVTAEQLKAAEDNGTLCGYNPRNKTALIRS